ncbi:hypothetical protein [Serratia fonticola]|uniref:hypothetical protein n=1 Tax=Serratia fonticola TaxID=47917 RepID=UPI00164609A7|nr:hypothetical protein [Serratia fonticola]MBC3228325.1 hypothetical protein [Serratia fonticola]
MNQLPINDPQLMRPINRLLQAGIKVIELKTNFRRPVIVVDRPFKAWEANAVEITETRNGVHRQVHMTIWRGAHVIWR